jgi:hypothetical protein
MTCRGYVFTIMQFLHGINWLRLVAAVALFCLAGQGIASEFEHLGYSHAHAHHGEHPDESNVPTEENPAQHEHLGHHHHSDMIFWGSKMPLPMESASSFVSTDIRCHDGPVFGIEYPPQLS